MGILAFFGLPIIGIIIGIVTLLAAGCGFAGAYFNSPKLLWFFMCGVIIISIITIVSLILALIRTSWFSVAINALELIILATGWFVAFVVRGKSFQWGFINLGPDAKKPTQPLSSVV